MKALLLSFILSFTALYVGAQEIEKYVFSSGSGTATNGYGETVSYTIGQSFFTNTLTQDNSVYLTQGFEQPIPGLQDILFAGSAHPDLNILKMEVYPNPAVDYTDLELNLIDNDGARVSLIDMWGQIVKAKDFSVSSGNQKLHFEFGFLAPGVYTINVKANKRSYAKKLLVSGSSRTSSTF